jgi:serine/threonine protein kinase
LVAGAEIGSGAIATVRVVTGAHSGHRFAAKILHARHERDAGARARFEREAELASALIHPNVVRVFGVRSVDQRTALLMELVDGPTLATLLARQGPLPPTTLLTIATDIAQGLSYAHARGVIHRDLKPANILVVSGPRPTAKIADFGMARAASFAAADRRALTVLGTPPYMAPECLDPLAVDPRTDLYALGCMVHELATGAPPYAGSTPHAVLEAHRNAPIPALPEAYGPELAALVRRLLAKAPGERPQSAGAVVDALRAIATPTATPSAALVPTRSPNHGECAQCGADVLPELRVCIRCGMVQVFIQPGAYSVLVVGPGQTTHKFSTKLRDRLVRWVRANTALGLDASALERHIPRVAFPLIAKVSEASARTLVEAMTHLGIQAESVRGGPKTHPAAQRVLGALLKRGLTVPLAVFAFPVFLNPFIGAMSVVLGGILTFPIAWIFATRSAYREALTRGPVAAQHALPPSLQSSLDALPTVVPALREARHRDALRAVVHRTVSLTRPLDSAQRDAVADEMARAVSMAATAAVRMDALDAAMAHADFDPANPTHRATMHERDRWSARLLDLTAALDALAARRASAADRVQHNAEDEVLASLRASVESLEEVQSL